MAVTIDGATTSIAVDDAAVENQEEQVELVADRMEAMRNKHDEEVRRRVTLTSCTKDINRVCCRSSLSVRRSCCSVTLQDMTLPMAG